jgi:hypothetical protein
MVPLFWAAKRHRIMLFCIAGNYSYQKLFFFEHVPVLAVPSSFKAVPHQNLPFPLGKVDSSQVAVWHDSLQ